MTSFADATAVTPLSPISAAKPMAFLRGNWTSWAGVFVSFAILGAVAWHLGDERLTRILAHPPADPWFWLTFAGFYLSLPVADWLIFRRLWGLPLNGVVPLMKKRVSNELLIGYSGEVYFYAWARQHLRLNASPFGAVKDVTILSAIMGNVATLILLVATAPLLADLLPQIDVALNPVPFLASALVVLLSSLGVMLFRRRLFSLDPAELRFVAGVQMGRIVIDAALLAVMWHLALPAVALGWWLTLATGRQLISRLPFLPNKDVVFAAVAVFLVGQQDGIGELMALVATLILATNILMAIVLALEQFWRGRA